MRSRPLGCKGRTGAALLILATACAAPSEDAPVSESEGTTEAQSAAASATDLEPIRAALLEEILPVTLENCELERFGTTDDGDYLLCGNLSEEVESAYSYGVGRDDSFGCDVSERFGVTVHQYDCFDPARPVCPGGNFVFHDECIGPERSTEGKRRFDTLESHIEGNGDGARRLIVKLDIEGAEWDSLLAAPDEVLDRIDQLAVEFHRVDEAKTLDLVRRLKSRFHPVSLHFNNQACGGADPLPGWAFQVLWVNRRIGRQDETAHFPAPPSGLETPDDPSQPDCQLAPTPTPEPTKVRPARAAKRDRAEAGNPDRGRRAKRRAQQD